MACFPKRRLPLTRPSLLSKLSMARIVYNIQRCIGSHNTCSASRISMTSIVTASVPFYVPPADGSRAFVHVNVDADGVRKQNYERHSEDIFIENIRGKEASFTLDTAGFQFYNRPASHKTFQTNEEIEKEYYPESIEIIKELTGASRVVLFDHTVRRRDPSVVDTSPDKRQPASAAHVDQTPQASIARVHRHLPAEEAPDLLKRRFQLINLWRPISHPADDWPLAVCDYRSVDSEKDVVPVSLIYPDREPGETYGVVYSPKQAWKYLRGMTPDELLLIKCFDSIQDGSVAQFTPHTAFEDPSTPPDAPWRQSIELRALVFYND